MQGKLTNHQIEALLRRQIIGRIGCHANGTTYIVPISYAYDGECVYAHTYEGLKIDTMRINPAVCFEVEQMENMANWQTVVAQGQYEELTSAAEKRLAIDKLMRRNFPMQSSSTVKFSKYWPFAPADDEEIKGLFFRIRLTEKWGRFEKPCNDESKCSGNCRVKKVSSLEGILSK